MPDYERGDCEGFAFVSSGDPDRDGAIMRHHMQSDRRIAEGMCPNGCGPMLQPSPSEQECPKCRFHYERVLLGGT
jgi:hypothetical protein